MSLLACERVTVSFPGRRRGDGGVTALRDVSLAVGADEVLGIVGESGSGKSTLARVMVGLHRPTDGTVVLEEDAVGGRPRGQRISMVFQDPRSSLNPRLSIGAIVADPLAVHRIGSRRERRTRAVELLEQVGLPASARTRKARQLSGGQLQRVAIARALALEPELIVADEPTSALDVSIQAQILKLLIELRRERAFSLVLISHDMRVVRAIADRIVVMKDGEIVEEAPAGALFARPQHPYTRALLSAAPGITTEGA